MKGQNWSIIVEALLTSLLIAFCREAHPARVAMDNVVLSRKPEQSAGPNSMVLVCVDPNTQTSRAVLQVLFKVMSSRFHLQQC
jgi:hypothetical protein